MLVTYGSFWPLFKRALDRCDQGHHMVHIYYYPCPDGIASLTLIEMLIPQGVQVAMTPIKDNDTLRLKAIELAKSATTEIPLLILINLGAHTNLPLWFGDDNNTGVEQPDFQEGAHGRKERTHIWVFDSHRPFDLDNVHDGHADGASASVHVCLTHFDLTVLNNTNMKVAEDQDHHRYPKHTSMFEEDLANEYGLDEDGDIDVDVDLDDEDDDDPMAAGNQRDQEGQEGQGAGGGGGSNGDRGQGEEDGGEEARRKRLRRADAPEGESGRDQDETQEAARAKRREKRRQHIQQLRRANEVAMHRYYAGVWKATPTACFLRRVLSMNDKAIVTAEAIWAEQVALVWSWQLGLIGERVYRVRIDAAQNLMTEQHIDWGALSIDPVDLLLPLYRQQTIRRAMQCSEILYRTLRYFLGDAQAKRNINRCLTCLGEHRTSRYENDSWMQMLETMQDKIRTKLDDSVREHFGHPQETILEYPTFKRKLEHRRDNRLFPEMTPLDVAHVLMTLWDHSPADVRSAITCSPCAALTEGISGAIALQQALFDVVTQCRTGTTQECVYADMRFTVYQADITNEEFCDLLGEPLMLRRMAKLLSENPKSPNEEMENYSGEAKNVCLIVNITEARARVIGYRPGMSRETPNPFNQWFNWVRHHHIDGGQHAITYTDYDRSILTIDSDMLEKFVEALIGDHKDSAN
mmetsp:Transcript_112/g.374  ORF Transcript_112/g.374 Transcript_112/m.374 type:complete len:692 (+) Transcript_112:205-2280(+)